jgi:hypothetical protein
MVQIQYASDLHITDWPKGTAFETFLTPVAPILVLAGDICSAWDPLYKNFLVWCSRHWHIVILITGNHEYYPLSGHTVTIDQTDHYIRSIAPHNVIFLQAGQSYTVPGTRLRFVGATLWSAIDPALWQEAAEKKGDYKHISIGVPMMGLRKAHPCDTTALHALHKAYLTSAIAPQQYKETLIVVTHHMPTLNLLEERFRGERWHSCYVSADDDLLAPNVKLWICGHSHRATQWRAPSGTLCLMNARGYNKPGEQQRTEDIYNLRAVVNIALQR